MNKPGHLPFGRLAPDISQHVLYRTKASAGPDTTYAGYYPLVREEFTGTNIREGVVESFSELKDETACLDFESFEDKRKVLSEQLLKSAKRARLITPVLESANEEKRELWLNNLASSTPLSELASHPPDLKHPMSFLSIKNVPVARATWFIKIIYLNKEKEKGKRAEAWLKAVYHAVDQVINEAMNELVPSSSRSRATSSTSSSSAATRRNITNSDGSTQLQRGWERWKYTQELLMWHYVEGLVSRWGILNQVLPRASQILQACMNPNYATSQLSYIVQCCFWMDLVTCFLSDITLCRPQARRLVKFLHIFLSSQPKFIPFFVPSGSKSMFVLGMSASGVLTTSGVLASFNDMRDTSSATDTLGIRRKMRQLSLHMLAYVLNSVPHATVWIVPRVDSVSRTMFRILPHLSSPSIVHSPLRRIPSPAREPGSKRATTEVVLSYPFPRFATVLVGAPHHHTILSSVCVLPNKLGYVSPPACGCACSSLRNTADHFHHDETRNGADPTIGERLQSSASWCEVAAHVLSVLDEAAAHAGNYRQMQQKTAVDLSAAAADTTIGNLAGSASATTVDLPSLSVKPSPYDSVVRFLLAVPSFAATAVGSSAAGPGGAFLNRSVLLLVLEWGASASRSHYVYGPVLVAHVLRLAMDVVEPNVHPFRHKPKVEGTLDSDEKVAAVLAELQDVCYHFLDTFPLASRYELERVCSLFDSLTAGGFFLPHVYLRRLFRSGALRYDRAAASSTSSSLSSSASSSASTTSSSSEPVVPQAPPSVSLYDRRHFHYVEQFAWRRCSQAQRTERSIALYGVSSGVEKDVRLHKLLFFEVLRYFVSISGGAFLPSLWRSVNKECLWDARDRAAFPLLFECCYPADQFETVGEPDIMADASRIDFRVDLLDVLRAVPFFHSCRVLVWFESPLRDFLSSVCGGTPSALSKSSVPPANQLSSAHQSMLEEMICGWSYALEGLGCLTLVCGWATWILVELHVFDYLALSLIRRHFPVFVIEQRLNSLKDECVYAMRRLPNLKAAEIWMEEASLPDQRLEAQLRDSLNSLFSSSKTSLTQSVAPSTGALFTRTTVPAVRALKPRELLTLFCTEVPLHCPSSPSTDSPASMEVDGSSMSHTTSIYIGLDEVLAGLRPHINSRDNLVGVLTEVVRQVLLLARMCSFVVYASSPLAFRIRSKLTQLSFIVREVNQMSNIELSVQRINCKEVMASLLQKLFNNVSSLYVPSSPFLEKEFSVPHFDSVSHPWTRLRDWLISFVFVLVSRDMLPLKSLFNSRGFVASGFFSTLSTTTAPLASLAFENNMYTHLVGCLLGVFPRPLSMCSWQDQLIAGALLISEDFATVFPILQAAVTAHVAKCPLVPTCLLTTGGNAAPDPNGSASSKHATPDDDMLARTNNGGNMTACHSVVDLSGDCSAVVHWLLLNPNLMAVLFNDPSALDAKLRTIPFAGAVVFMRWLSASHAALIASPPPVTYSSFRGFLFDVAGPLQQLSIWTMFRDFSLLRLVVDSPIGASSGQLVSALLASFPVEQSAVATASRVPNICGGVRSLMLTRLNPIVAKAALERVQLVLEKESSTTKRHLQLPPGSAQKLEEWKALTRPVTSRSSPSTDACVSSTGATLFTDILGRDDGCFSSPEDMAVQDALSMIVAQFSENSLTLPGNARDDFVEFLHRQLAELLEVTKSSPAALLVEKLRLRLQTSVLWRLRCIDCFLDPLLQSCGLALGKVQTAKLVQLQSLIETILSLAVLPAIYIRDTLSCADAVDGSSELDADVCLRTFGAALSETFHLALRTVHYVLDYLSLFAQSQPKDVIAHVQRVLTKILTESFAPVKDSRSACVALLLLQTLPLDEDTLPLRALTIFAPSYAGQNGVSDTGGAKIGSRSATASGAASMPSFDPWSMLEGVPSTAVADAILQASQSIAVMGSGSSQLETDSATQ